MKKSEQKYYVYIYNPITGEKDKVLKAGYYKDPLTGQIREIRNDFYIGRPLTKSEQKALAVAMLIVLIIFSIYYLWIWISTHILASILIAVLIISGAVIFLWKFPSIKKTLLNKIKIFGPIEDEGVKDLIDVIKGMKVQEVRNEEDFEKQLYQRLDAKGYKVQRQVNLGQKKRVDLIVDEDIGIELKIAYRAKNVQDLIGQATIYKNYLRKLIVVILDTGSTENLQEYCELIKNVDAEKINVVLLKGNMRRYKKKEEYFLVKKETSRY